MSIVTAAAMGVTSAANAEPVQLTNEQMASLTACPELIQPGEACPVAAQEPGQQQIINNLRRQFQFSEDLPPGLLEQLTQQR